VSAPDVRAALEALGVPHEIIPIDPAFADTAAFCATYGYPPEHSANTIVVASRKEPKRFGVCVVPATRKLDVNGIVRRLMEVSRASFATAEEMRAHTGMEVGGVTPLALPPGWPLYVDASLMALEWVIIGGGGRDFKVKAPPALFTRLGAQVVEGLGIEPPPPR
jgi:prolyl-tRNA editing enzyme YbaK/EbsC (Cys-tRNA(Pro) deacylase)